ncbi:MAG: four helix bundle protein [Muribaculaceae bacterium]|nr:four helix bundle protein [Muribaculaceae bacterium]
MNLFSFEKLDAYQESRKLAVEVYRIIQELPSYERFDLGSQLRRSIISVSSNIAEGCGRVSLREKIHFLEIAYGSMLEAYSQIQLSVDLNYTHPERMTMLQPKFSYVANLINSLRKSYMIKLENNNQKSTPNQNSQSNSNKLND